MKKVLALLLISALGMAAGCATMEEKQAYYNANVQMAALKKPLVYIKAKEGQEITLKGVEEFAVYAPGAEGVAQYKDEGVEVAKAAIGVAGAVGGSLVAGENAVRLVEAVKGMGAVTTINAQGDQSAVHYAPGNSTGDTQINPSDRHDSTDSHDIEEVADE